MRNDIMDMHIVNADSSTDAIWLEKRSPSQTAPPDQVSLSFDKIAVKQELPDEAEIRELAAKMVEANKAKMVTGVAGPPQQRPPQCLLPQSNLPGILGYLNKRPADSSTGAPTKPLPAEGKVPPDDESQRGRFGWTSFDDCHIPYIFRSGEKYCAVRILESKLLNKYLSYLHSDIYSCTCIRSYYITEAESKLFTEINVKHCENQFGRDQFTCKDLVVRLSDAKEFYTFLDVCYTKLTAGTNPNVSGGHKAEKCGFIRINKESVVPYTVKDGLQYVPLFYFEGETENLKLKAEKLEGWDLSYLKFCCKVQGIRNELFASETCSVISLNDIKSYFPPGTGFEDYWPTKVMDSQLLVTSKGSGTGGGWTKQPPTPPATKPVTVQNNVNKAPIDARVAPIRNILPRGSVSNASQVQQQQRGVVNQPRPVVTTHPAHSSPTALPPGRPNIVTQPMLNSVQNVNGWTGLVGGQPTFQTALVSQANSIIRMPSTLNMHSQMSTQPKNYSQQPTRSRGGGGSATAQYPGVYPVTTMQTVAQAQPPPLVRATVHSSQSNLGYPTYGKDDWVTSTYTTPSLGVPNAVTANTYPQMLGLSEQVQALMPSPTSTLLHQQRHTPSVHNASHTKYPPPLIPVNGNNNNSRDSRGRKQLISIPETHVSTCQVQPYQIQKALVEDKMVPCINFKPYIYSELLMTLSDFVAQYFPACDINGCRQVITDVLHIDLYQGNRLQMNMLMEAGKCSSLNEELPLIQVKSIMKYMPQLKYMFNRGDMVIAPAPAHSSEEHPAKKRQRTS
ncbi:uncharacterized protein LOC128890325 isoform X1 [Hylaeus anthracinus]|uniref:uncharacterized protein LOC128890325 isoform X1 n=1 Tax=Hylaeus anthracinus TaxID=313031 RepID=UPI0023B90817|nr:uncharacterized protein LOC128890325 isoform X1 [Hylaeus anthracinus]